MKPITPITMLTPDEPRNQVETITQPTITTTSESQIPHIIDNDIDNHEDVYEQYYDQDENKEEDYNEEEYKEDF